MRTVFFGTPDFAVPSLEALLDAGIEVPLVVTQPDRPVGRHAEAAPSAVALAAAARGLPTRKPEKVRGDAELLERLRGAAPDAIAVVAYGHILPKEILEQPRLGCVNVHASLLPRHRGASPIAAAILAGDSETGVVTMRMEEGLDAGPLYLERHEPIGARETAGSLSARLAREGAELLVETLRGLEAGTLAARPQEGEPSVCRTLRREDGEADWTLSAEALERRVRAYTPWPGLFAFLGGERVKILEAQAGRSERVEEPGVFWVERGEFLVAAGGGTALSVGRLQRAGRKPVSGAEFARGLAATGRFDRRPPAA